MKQQILFVFSIATLLFTACSKNDDDGNNPSTPQAKVKFVHAAIIGDSLQVRSNNTAIAGVPKLGFMNSSGYVNVNTGSATYGFYSTATGTLYEDTTINFAANNNYTVYATGGFSGTGIVVTTDDLTAPASGKAKIRFINLSPDNINLRTELNGSATDSNISYKGVTAFREVNAGTYTVAAGGSTIASGVSLSGQNLQSGKIYTYIYNGVSTGTGTPNAYSLIQIQHN